MLNPTRNATLDVAVEQAMARYEAETPRSRARYSQACGVMPGGNTRSVLHFSPYPLTFEHGEGVRLRDLDGITYTDFLGEYTAGLYGHSNAQIRAAVREALDGGIVLCAPNVYEVELASLLCERFPSCDRVRFCNSGTESNLMALGAARTFTGRDRIMVFNGAYHGGVLYFVHGASPINVPFPVVLGEYNDLEKTIALIDQHGDQLAAILVEPMSGSGGCIPADREFLAGLRAAADKHGIVLIFDEVMTSRLSPGGLQQALDVIPDLTTFGKYIGGGLTFGAFGGRADIMDQFDPRRPDALPHAGTFNNNVLTMHAGLTGLRDIYTPDVIRAHNARGDAFRESLNAAIAKREFPAQVTGLGSLLCVHFQRGAIRRTSDTDKTDQRIHTLLHLEMLHSGYYHARRGFMSLSLPLVEADYQGFQAAFEEFLDTSQALLGPDSG